MQNFNMPQYGVPSMRAPYNQTQYYTPTPQVPLIKYVTSRNEAEAITPDISGAPTFFFNRGNNEIYLKQMDLQTGLSIFKEFIEKPMPEAEVKPAISIDTLNTKLDEIIKSLTEQTTAKKKVVKDE